PKRPRPKKLGTVRLKSQETKSLVSAKVLRRTQRNPDRLVKRTADTYQNRKQSPLKASSTQPDQALDPIPSCVKPAPPKSAPNERSVAIGTHKPERALFKDVHDWKEALLIWADIVKLNVPANQPRSRNQEPRPQHSSTRLAPSGSAPSGTAPSGTDSSRWGPPPPYKSDSDSSGSPIPPRRPKKKKTPARQKTPIDISSSSEEEEELKPSLQAHLPALTTPPPNLKQSPVPLGLVLAPVPLALILAPVLLVLVLLVPVLLVLVLLVPSPRPASPRPASLRPASPRPASPCPASPRPASPCPASPQLAPDREECEAEFVAGQIPDNTAERREVIPYGTA
ncbi:hypothetical protein PSHT_12435, partial [Puccinia striiformis]